MPQLRKYAEVPDASYRPYRKAQEMRVLRPFIFGEGRVEERVTLIMARACCFFLSLGTYN